MAHEGAAAILRNISVAIRVFRNDNETRVTWASHACYMGGEAKTAAQSYYAWKLPAVLISFYFTFTFRFTFRLTFTFRLRFTARPVSPCYLKGWGTFCWII